MISWLAMASLAAPVLGPPVDRLQQCVQAAGEVHQAQPPPRTDRLAVVVGVPCHRHPSVPPLEFASHDAMRVAAELEGRGYHVMRLTTLVDAADLDRALALAAEAITDDGELIVYLSGHGVLQQQGTALQRYLVMSDTDLTRVEQTGVPAERIEAAVGRAGGARRVLVQDTCFASQPLALSGAPGERAKNALLPAKAPPPETGVLRLYASRFFEQAIESRSLGGSVYTHFLLGGLADPASDLDRNGCVDLLEAHEASRRATTEHRHGFQNPTADWTSLASIRGTLACDAPGSAPVLAFPSALEVEVDAAPASPVAVLTDGAHQLRVRAAGRDTHSVLHAKPGEWTDARQVVPSRRWQTHVRVAAAIHPAPALPTASVGGELWGGLPVGRSVILAGLEGGWSPAYEGDASCLAFRSQRVGGRVAWLAGSDELKLGPTVGAGGVHRSATNTCRELDLLQGWGTDLRSSAQLLWTPSVLSVGVDLGVDAVRVGAEDPHWQVGPLAGVSVGLWR